MRVLVGNAGEELNIGPQITITVLAVGGETVRLAIEAPDHLAIHKAVPPPAAAPLPSGECSPKASDESRYFAEFA